MEVDIGMDEKARGAIADVLKTLLASTFALYVKTLNYHWNLVGPRFYSLHVLFQKGYEELAETVDEMAERVRALGFFVEGGLGVFKEKSLVDDEEKCDLDIDSMIKNQVRDHEIIIGFIRSHLSEVEGYKDGATADFLNKRLAVHEKMSWMMRSSL